MDLSFRFPDAAAATELSDADVAVLVGLLAGRQATSATAQVQAAIDTPAATGEALLAPADGRFNTAMAARLAVWKQE